MTERRDAIDTTLAALIDGYETERRRDKQRIALLEHELLRAYGDIERMAEKLGALGRTGLFTSIAKRSTT